MNNPFKQHTITHMSLQCCDTIQSHLIHLKFEASLNKRRRAKQCHIEARNRSGFEEKTDFLFQKTDK